MDERKLVEGFDLAPSFAAGVASVAREHGMNEKDAEAFVCGICKEAARRRRIDIDDEDTFWERNKSWLIPVLAGSLAFYVGADGERYGRKDRSYLSNAGSRLWDKAKDLLRVNQDPLFEAATKPMMEAK